MAASTGKHLLTTVRQTLKTLSSTNTFDRLLGKVQVVAAEPGRLKAQFTVGEEHVNGYGTLHGGYTSYLTDVISTVALTTIGDGHPGVSVELSVAYMRSAAAGEVVTVDAETLKSGRLLTFSTVDFRNSAGKLLAQGKHTKYVGGQ